MPEFTDACSEICSTQEPRNGFSFSKIHHQVMNIFFFFLFGIKFLLFEQGLCWGNSHTSVSLSAASQNPQSRIWGLSWGQHSFG